MPGGASAAESADGVGRRSWWAKLAGLGRSSGSYRNRHHERARLHPTLASPATYLLASSEPRVHVWAPQRSFQCWQGQLRPRKGAAGMVLGSSAADHSGDPPPQRQSRSLDARGRGHPVSPHAMRKGALGLPGGDLQAPRFRVTRRPPGTRIPFPAASASGVRPAVALPACPLAKPPRCVPATTLREPEFRESTEGAAFTRGSRKLDVSRAHWTWPSRGSRFCLFCFGRA